MPRRYKLGKSLGTFFHKLRKAIRFRQGKSLGAPFRVLQRVIHGGGQPEVIPIPQVTIEYIDRNYVIFVEPLKIISLQQEQIVKTKSLNVITKKDFNIFFHELSVIAQKISNIVANKLMILKNHSKSISASKLQLSINSNLEINTKPLEFETFISQQEEKAIDTLPLSVVNEGEITVFIPALDIISGNSYVIPVMPLSIRKSKNVKLKELMDILDIIDELD